MGPFEDTSGPFWDPLGPFWTFSGPFQSLNFHYPQTEYLWSHFKLWKYNDLICGVNCDCNWALIIGQSFGFLLFTFWVTFSRRLQLFPLLDFPQCKFYYIYVKIQSLSSKPQVPSMYDARKYARFQFSAKMLLVCLGPIIICKYS